MTKNGKLDEERHLEAKTWLAGQCIERGITALPVGDAYGLYGGEQELAIDFRGIANGRAEFEAVGQLVRDFGQRYGQTDVFLSEYVVEGHKNARPLFILPPSDDSLSWQARTTHISNRWSIDGFTVVPSPGMSDIGIIFHQPIPEIALRYDRNYPNTCERELENYAADALRGLALKCRETLKVVSVSTQCWGAGEYCADFSAGHSKSATLESEIERRQKLLDMLVGRAGEEFRY